MNALVIASRLVSAMLVPMAFDALRRNIATVLMYVLGLAAAVTLTMIVIYIVQGDQDSAKKFAAWFAATALGFILISIIKGL